MVPKRMDASCVALRPTRGRSSSSSSSSEEALSETTDHSSSSGRTRGGRGPGTPPSPMIDGCGWASVLFSCVSRWNGLVDTSVGFDVADGSDAWLADALDCAIFFKNGFFDSVSGAVGGSGVARGELTVDDADGWLGCAALDMVSTDVSMDGICRCGSSWLIVGVVSWGVASRAAFPEASSSSSSPSSSDESSAARRSSCS